MISNGNHRSRATAKTGGAYLAGLAVLAAVSRLPQLLGPNLLVDGDEAVLGLMAKHLAHGRELPVFFYGQHYGFSSIEAAAGAFSFLAFGTGALALKIAMLALWIAGVLFLHLALSRVVGRGPSFLMLCVFVLSPAWAVWSMKARGGYLTAFAATSVLMWLLTRDEARTEGRWAAAGVLTAVICGAQPLWLPGVLPIVAAALIADRRWLWAISYLCVSATPVLFLRIASITSGDAWGGPALGGVDLAAALQSLPAIGHQIYVNFTGSYYLGWAIDPPGPVTWILAVTWCGTLAAAGLLQIYRLVARRYLLSSHLLFLGIVLTVVAEALALRARDARYLLPISALLIALVGIEIQDLVARWLRGRRAALAAACVALIAGGVSMMEFRAFAYLWNNPSGSMSEAARMRRVIDVLHSQGIAHVYSMNGLLGMQLVFYSDEQVVSRSADLTDRYPPYVIAVDRALAGGQPVAVIGYTNTSGAPGCWDVPICTGGIERIVSNPEAIVTVDGKYFVYPGADRSLLRRLHFQILD
jgi:hypothetical protein